MSIHRRRKYFKTGWKNNKLQNQDRCLIDIFIAVLPKIGWAMGMDPPLSYTLVKYVFNKVIGYYYPLSIRLGYEAIHN